MSDRAENGTLRQSGTTIITDQKAWMQYTGTCTVPAGQTSTRFAVQAVSAGSDGNFLDDVVVTREACQ